MGSRAGAQGWLPRALTQARKSVGLSQADLAKRLKVSRQMIVRYETEDGAAPAAEKLRALAQELGASPSAFIDSHAQGMAVLRARVGLSQKQVVEQVRTDLSLQAYRGVESGRVARLRSMDAQALAEVFGVTAEDIRAAHEHDLSRTRQNVTAPHTFAGDSATTQT
ncbi:helix-turn-helix domain-containing protein [Nocardiopsis tropica]|uniref:Helix-turn-helix domain-containing protein n=1 Tax=Nocardiopsis tropica TaxID=109330 RepID=A0ABU7KMX2_9ACTN|nr:helix-turn-helix domain-containing protein [Nocardiopsis umidischolae]MEE2050601.1 helix-turn-helix domain-containing protein [Nocardiopsis umidischolae]